MWKYLHRNGIQYEETNEISKGDSRGSTEKDKLTEAWITPTLRVLGKEKES